MKQRRCQCLECEKPFTQVRLDDGNYPRNCCPHCGCTTYIFEEEQDLSARIRERDNNKKHIRISTIPFEEITVEQLFTLAFAPEESPMADMNLQLECDADERRVIIVEEVDDQYGL